MHLSDLREKEIKELISMATELKIENPSSLRRHELIFSILKTMAKNNEDIYGGGVLEILPDGFGFLRSPGYNYLPGADDIYVSPSQIRRFGLRKGDTTEGQIRPPKDGERYFALLKVNKINYQTPEVHKKTVLFENLTPLYPEKKISLEFDKKKLSTRIIDLFVPQGFGQRCLIVAPPKAGKTELLKEIANAITKNHNDSKLIVLLIDERPEEVTDMKRSVDAEVIASTFDEGPERHVQVSDMALAKAQRLVECGKDVVILLDSITRLGRAHNAVIPHSGKILSGGVDSNALRKPKKFFGAARNTEEGGSLSIIATALIDTGSKMDGVIFEEFKGTGNMELVLDRELSDRRIYPAFNIVKSGTRKEELLLSDQHLSRMWILRKMLGEMSTEQAMQFMTDRMRRTKTNQEFLDLMSQ